jgi:hypothetical protein
MTASALSRLFLGAFGHKKSMEKRLFGKDGVKGAFFAFISTLDTGLPKPTIVQGTNLRLFLRFVPYLKTVLPCETPQARTLHSITLDGNRLGSTNHVFGPVLHHDFLFKLLP